MKKLSYITLIITAAVVIVSCSDVKRTPGSDYMPDMRYSRAYETYSPNDLKANGINYTGMPVAGTVQRGETIPFQIAKDKDGDSTNYVASRGVTNPLPALNADQMKEAERLYLINCGICHGTKLDGNGPLYNGGNGPYPAAPRNLVNDAHVLSMSDGQLMYSITYGKGSMGPYGPQLTTSQRWMIIHYMKEKQGRGAGGGATVQAGSAAATPTGEAATGNAAQGNAADTANAR
jgi:mono/diheme cytochrome c family protein